MQYLNERAFAKELDNEDELKSFRDRFFIPKHDGKETIYFTGNSLGLQPKSVQEFISEELDVWKTLGVEGHFAAPKRPWMYYHKFSKEALAALLGAKPSEVVSMNNLTSNLHLMMVSFYRPKGKRTKIMIEGEAFPSDHYAVESQIGYHGYNYRENIIELVPEKGKSYLSTSNILEKIEEHKEELALILLPGVQYYTGQFFDMKAITQAGHKAGAFVGFDLAHAIGNLPLQMHDTDVDFAVWCSYKYLNSGPGNISGIFVHERHGNDKDLPRFAGWWGYDEENRFKMEKGFQPMPGADGWQLSNYNVLSGAAHLASLEIFQEAGIDRLRAKSVKLTGFLEFLIKEEFDSDSMEVLTPTDPERRGCQLSLRCKSNGRQVFENLLKAGVSADWREPEVIRVAPVPLYNKFEEVFDFVQLMKQMIYGK